jgi:hypothetical protein
LLLPSAAPPMSRPLLSLPLTSVIASVKHVSPRVVLVVACSFADASGQLYFPKTSRENHSVAWILVRALLLRSRRCWDARSGVNSMSRIDCRRPFFQCYRCCRLIALFLFRQDVSNFHC